jgi:hypothetical protein
VLTVEDWAAIRRLYRSKKLSQAWAINVEGEQFRNSAATRRLLR